MAAIPSVHVGCGDIPSWCYFIVRDGGGEVQLCKISVFLSGLGAKSPSLFSS